MHLHTGSIRILLAEDNPADIRLTEEGLREAGLPYELCIARDGQQALDILFRCQDAPESEPDLVLLDLNLPRKNGFDVLRELKSAGQLCHIPVVVFSSSLSEMDVAKAYELNANCFVRKPGDLDDTFRVLKSIVAFWSATACLPNGHGHCLAVTR